MSSPHENHFESSPLTSGMHVLFPLGFDSQVVVHRDYGHGERSSSIVSNDGKHSGERVTAQHRVFVIRGVHHHVRMPRANSRPEILVRREHLRQGHGLHSWQFAFGVCRLNSFGNLVRCLAFHSELGAQLLQRQNGSTGDGIEADRRAEFCIVHEVPELCRRKRRCPPAAHDDAHEAVITLGGDLVSGGCKYLDRGIRRNVLRHRTSCQCHLAASGRGHASVCDPALNVSSSVVKLGEVLATLVAAGRNTQTLCP